MHVSRCTQHVQPYLEGRVVITSSKQEQKAVVSAGAAVTAVDEADEVVQRVSCSTRCGMSLH